MPRLAAVWAVMKERSGHLGCDLCTDLLLGLGQALLGELGPPVTVRNEGLQVLCSLRDKDGERKNDRQKESRTVKRFSCTGKARQAIHTYTRTCVHTHGYARTLRAIETLKV